MKSEELIAGIEDDYCPHSPVNDEAAAFGLALIEVVRERDLMRDAIRGSLNMEAGTDALQRWASLIVSLRIGTDSPLVDLSTATETSEK